MKRFASSLLLLFAVFLIGSNYRAFSQPASRYFDSKDLSVLVNAVVAENPPRIILNWQKNELADSYEVRKKKFGETSWSQPIGFNNADETSFADNNVSLSEVYEYEVRAICRGLLNAKTSDNRDTVITIIFYGFGYALAAVSAGEFYERGKALLLVDSTVFEPLKTEIERFEDDLIAEGWAVETRLTPRAESFDKDGVAKTKGIIRDVKNSSGPKLTSVILLGRVPVPYSGDTYPDAHTDHRGAWPADVYYAVLNENAWSDWTVNVTSATREQNKNVPGDGKFDQSSVEAVDLQVGRIDFFDMPAFSKNEIELLKNYLDKNHQYRTKQFSPLKRGIIDDNFPARNIYEAFASSGWRNLGTLVNYDSVFARDFFTELSTDSYLWSYGCGVGSYSSAGGIGNANDFASKQVNSVFTMLFGSYFGDWDSRNNLMRAALCSEPMALTCAWAGRPHWYFHYMGLGMPIGYSTKLTQNNYGIYVPCFYYLPAYPNGVVYSVGFRGTHVALMGDPTLTMYPMEIPQPKSLSVFQTFEKSVELQWEAPEEPVIGYHVYRYTDKKDLVRLTIEPVAETFYNDQTELLGFVNYMVRSVGYAQSETGRFLSESRGISEIGFITNVEAEERAEFSANVFPSPATDKISISLVLPKPAYAKIELFNASGRIVKTIYDSYLAGGGHTFGALLTDENGSKLQSGMYFVRVQSGSGIAIKKLVVIK